jgi:hypothetical protein
MIESMQAGWSARCSLGNRLVHDRVTSHEYGGFDLAAPHPDVGQRAIVEVLQPAHAAALRRRHCKPAAGQRLRDLLPPGVADGVRAATADVVKAGRMIGSMAR